MSIVAPRQMVFRGRVEAAGLWLTTGDPIARALAQWAPGDQILEGPCGVVLRFGQPRPVHTRRSWGVVLVSRGGRLVAAPLQRDELPPEPGGVWGVRAGRPVRLDPLVPVDLSAHVGLGEVLEGGVPLADPPPPVARQVVVSDPFAEVVVDRVGPLDLDPAVIATEAPSPTAGVMAAGYRAARGLLSWFRPGAGEGGSAPGAGARPGAAPGPDPMPPPAEDGWLSRADRWLAERLMQSGLGSMVGAAHARYLRELMERLSKEHLTDEDLRRAIPLGGSSGLGQALAGLFPGGRREGLEYRRAGGGAGGSVPVADALMERLESLYERAVERLVAEERFDEAAYVLGELLNRPLEAVAMLEEHGLYRRAAELAEAKELDAALIVRLWFLAGELQRALDVARRTGAMGVVLERLEARDPDQAALLRMAMATTLARAGAFGAAIDLLDGKVKDPSTLRRWREAAVAAGGHGAPRHLVGLLAHHPDALDDQQDALKALLRGSAPGPRKLLASSLLDATETPDNAVVLATVGRALWRAARQDLGQGRGWSPDLLARLAKQRAGIVTDRPPMMAPRPRSLVDREPMCFVGVSAADRGLGPVHDAHRLADGRWLLARGEDGVELRSPSGAVQRRWERPAHHLVVGEDGEVVVLTRRGTLTRLHRLRLSDGSARTWCEGRLDAWADRCSDLWFVGSEGRLMALDLGADELRAVWSVDLGAPVTAVVVQDQPGHCCVVATAGEELWRYELPQIVLRRRFPMADPRSGHQPGLRLEAGSAQLVGFAWMGEVLHGVDVTGTVQKRPLVRRPLHATAGHGGWWAVAGGEEVVLGQAAPPFRPRARVQLEGAGRIGLRLGGGRLVVCDDLGRVVSIGLTVDLVEQLRT